MRFHDRVEYYDSRIALLRKELKRFIRKKQKQCKHPLKSLREAPYKSFGYGSSLRPFRVCLECGLSEEGWGCGYQILHPGYPEDMATLSRDEAQKQVLRG